MARDQQRASSVTRRAVLRSLGTGVGALAVLPELSGASLEAFAALQRTQAAPKLLALTAAQYATVDALAEAIIPADGHSPGARAARVADYIDLLLSESDAETKQAWTTGLAALDAAAQQQSSAPFVKLTPAQTTELLTAISRDEFAPKTPAEAFFRAAKDATIRGYYTSEIGIHKDLQYQGNKILGEFVGCADPPKA